jgi:hypothetical protein
MMTVSEDVIFDLLPIYRSGLASPGTQALVQEWLAAHPDFDGAEAPPELAFATAEKAALSAARRLARWRRRLYGVAIGFTVLLLSTHIEVENGRLTVLRPVLLDYPWAFALVTVGTALSWWGYWRLSKRLAH